MCYQPRSNLTKANNTQNAASQLRFCPSKYNNIIVWNRAQTFRKKHLGQQAPRFTDLFTYKSISNSEKVSSQCKKFGHTGGHSGRNVKLSIVFYVPALLHVSCTSITHHLTREQEQRRQEIGGQDYICISENTVTGSIIFYVPWPLVNPLLHILWQLGVLGPIYYSIQQILQNLIPKTKQRCTNEAKLDTCNIKAMQC